MHSLSAKKTAHPRPTFLPSHPAPSTVALSIPDIVVHIFTFLAPAQIRFGAGRVCKQWQSLSLKFINNCCTWDSHATKGHELELSHNLRSARTFQCQYQESNHDSSSINDSVSSNSNDSINSSISSINGISPESERSLAKVITYLSSEEQQRIKHLIVRDLNNEPSKISIDVFAPFRSLVHLEISTKAVRSFELDTIFSMFPNLNELALGFLTFRSGNRSALVRHRPEEPWPSSVGKLRTLSFCCMTMDLSLLENLLSDCPELKELKLRSIQQLYPEPHGVGDSQFTTDRLVDGERLFPAVATRCPNLEMFLFSEGHRATSSKNIRALLRSFPDLKGYGLSLFSLGIFKCVISELVGVLEPELPMTSPFAAHLTALTTLEITPYSGSLSSSRVMYGSLHQILCAAPNLLHLKAGEAILDTHIMDYNNNYFGEKGIWACRKLKTFVVTTFRVGPDRSHFPEDRGNRQSRMFFAYLVRCCPRLQSIFIRDSDLRLQLESGLCLLSELKDLENLMIYTTSGYTLQERDLDWLSTLDVQQLSIWDRLRRWQTLASLKERKEDKTGWLLYQANQESQLTVQANAGTELWDSIIRTSSFECIKETLDRVQKKQKQGEYCWNKLATFWISQESMELAKRLRPQIAFQEGGIW